MQETAKSFLFSVIISGGLFIGGLYAGDGAKPLFLIFFDEFENFDQPVEVVARVVIDINSALAVVADCADLCAEIALHAADHVSQLRALAAVIFIACRAPVFNYFLRFANAQTPS